MSCGYIVTSGKFNLFGQLPKNGVSPKIPIWVLYIQIVPLRGVCVFSLVKLAHLLPDGLSHPYLIGLGYSPSFLSTALVSFGGVFVWLRNISINLWVKKVLTWSFYLTNSNVRMPLEMYNLQYLALDSLGVEYSMRKSISLSLKMSWKINLRGLLMTISILKGPSFR